MPRELDEWHAQAGGYVPRPSFEVYAEKYAEYFVMHRRDGILELRMHTDGGPARFDFAVHNAWAQAWQEIGNDPDNEVLIITGTGDRWLGVPDPVVTDPAAAAARLRQGERPRDFAYEHTYYDATKLLENFVFGIEIPTIAAINGPSVAHTEFALLCDITLASTAATIVDPHFLVGAAPGDGQQLTLQELIGTKRAAYHLYTGEPIGAQQALELGLVNEVLAADRLLPRAWELAEAIMKAPRAARRLTHAIAQRPWKRRLVQDLGFGLAHQMFGMRADGLVG
ncbi:enoyl-CoA hydratase/isomerase family protein [Pseudofrankia inefficax]|uniref:Enoyl-CoA hydratase/isomerase n=1 Tax=Pseudofrankia inefficax (strain DSM 45817 / CECT 9037 / DDB 130130 / EuI1c) TaxID=298654 RepID=E3JD72_PSEI1|nr:enoyl-CoA hydratase-related protein [Pseudofrankia inefficax]ADP82356.1 Enoyl-CoA hydratase/isomerase [Pseudofrankia inefficax]